MPIRTRQMQFLKIRSVSSGKVLSVPKYQLDAGVAIWQITDEDSNYQHWRNVGWHTGAGDDELVGQYDVLQSRATGKVLDVMESRIPETVGTPIIQWSRFQGDWRRHQNQLWKILEGQDGTFTISSHLSPVPTILGTGSVYYPPHATVLDVPGGTSDEHPVQLFLYNGGENQRWMIEYVELDNVVIMRNRASEKVLDVPGFSPDNTELQQYEFNHGTNQFWQVVPVEGNFVKIMNVASGKVLDVPSGTSDDVYIQQYTDNGGVNQQWSFVPVEKDYFTIVSRASGKVLDVEGSSPDSGAKILQWTSFAQENQQWEISPG
jgi:hypothetical protein